MILLGGKYCTIFVKNLRFKAHLKRIRQMEMRLCRTSSMVYTRKHWFVNFPIQACLKQGDALTPRFSTLL
jgi:hypothetical protein